MQNARTRLDVQLSGDAVVIRCDDDLDVAIAPELRDAIRCLPGSCNLHIDPSRLPTTAARADALGEHRDRLVEPTRAAQDGAANLLARAAEARATARAVGECAIQMRAEARAAQERAIHMRAQNARAGRTP